MAESGASIEVKDVRRVFEARDTSVVALDGVSLSISAGESVAIVGESGSGKSTLLHLIGGIDQPTSGAVTVDGVDITVLGTRSRADYRRRVGFVFQQYHLLPSLGLLENVVAPVAPYQRARDSRKKARRLLEEVGVIGRDRSLPGELSGGQQQRVAIARALINDPCIILADEPTGNLDPATAANVLEVLIDTRAERGTTLVLVTHDLAIARACDRVIHLH